MRDNKVVDWGAHVSDADYTLYKQDNLSNRVSLQKSDKIRSYSTSFYLADGTWLRSLHGSGDTWGYGSAPLGGNEFEQPLPDKVRVTYLDEVANQYYQGDYMLPTEKIYALMTSTNRKKIDSNPGSDSADKNYYAIELGFAPNGWVIIFVTGWSGRKEIASFQATPIEPDPKTIQGDPISSGDDSLLIDYEFYLKNKDVRKNESLEAFKNKSPKAYEKWRSGEWVISSDWYKKMQTKYPWNLSVSIDGQEWNGEYYAEFANTERFAVLDDQFETYHKMLKAVPTKISTWATDPDTGDRIEVEVHLFPRPQWAAQGTNKASYRPYYQDPNLNCFFKYFENLYPKRSLATNEQSTNADAFAALKLDFDKDLVLKEAYLQKGNQKISIEGAYQFSRAPIDPEEGQYIAKRGYPLFITEPNVEDLSDPAFVDID
ncbi:DUF2931 family protein [Psychrobacter sp. DAB_AL43B]|uniref:DUF2931 family protein n=1 Tax=Psychrobacter sp. DAB_AL43B TaxID=1028416 RepID=UPI0015537482|nr:DUF2931 family protein [Psychrobacter sp. DAB_AL43B]